MNTVFIGGVVMSIKVCLESGEGYHGGEIVISALNSRYFVTHFEGDEQVCEFDFDNYEDALADYLYSRYSNEGGVMFKKRMEELS